MIEKIWSYVGIKNIDLSWADNWLPNRLYNLSLRFYKIDNLLYKSLRSFV